MTVAVKRRASLEALESSVGKETLTDGLLTAKPALTFWLSDAMNWSRGGGHEQGMLMLLMPLQLLCARVRAIG